MFSQYGELRPTNGWDRFTSLGYPCKFQQVSRLGSVTAQHLVVVVSQTLRRWTEGATYIWQGDHHVGNWPTFLVLTWNHGLTDASVLSGETGNPEIASFHSMLHETRNAFKNIAWSQLNHHSLSKQSTVCTRQDLGREHSIIFYPHLDVYQACHCFGRCVKNGSFSYQAYGSESRWTVLLGYLTISTNVGCYYRVVYNNFVFPQKSAPVHLVFDTVQLLQCKTQLPFTWAVA